MKIMMNSMQNEDSLLNDVYGVGLKDVEELKKAIEESLSEIEKLKAENQCLSEANRNLAEENELLKEQLNQGVSVKQCGNNSLSRMELMVQNHDDPAGFIAQLKHKVALCNSPKEKMRVLLSEIDNKHLPVDLPHKLFDEVIEHIARTTYSNWMKTIRN